jgi:hypothetical protein
MQYIIAAGDTLGAIARRSGCTLEQLLTLNPTLRANPDRLAIGQAIALPQGAAPAPASWLLGSLSEHYETGGRGSTTVSGGVGDAGGVSYGSYQMTSAGGGTVTMFVREPSFPWRADFAALTAGTPAFTAKWIELAQAAPSAFKNAENEFIKRTHFDPLCAKIRAEEALDIPTHSPVMQDVIWSTAVQHGGATSIVHLAFTPLRAAGRFNPQDPSFEHDAIAAIYGERGRKDDTGVLVHFARNSPAVQAGVARRFESELAEALRRLGNV